MLHRVKTTVYFDSPKMKNPELQLENDAQSPHARLFEVLLENFSDIEFIPSTKGQFIERLRTKLKNLSKSNSNEIVPGNMSDILDAIKNKKSTKTHQKQETQ
jgi:hypothetical protein